MCWEGKTMKSKKSFFNGCLFGVMLKSSWVAWALHFLGLFFLLGRRFFDGDPEWMRMLADGSILSQYWLDLVIWKLAAGVLAALLVFRAAYDAKQTDFLCSLPISRDAAYGSSLLAGLAGLAAGDVLVLLCCAVGQASAGILNLPVLLFLLLLLFLLNLTFYGFAALCAMLTGSGIVLPLVYLVLEMTGAVVGGMIVFLLGALVFGYASVTLESFFVRLSPPAWLANSPPAFGRLTVAPGALAALCVYAVLGVGCALLGLLLYRRRAMETAGETVAVPVLRPVFRWCMALGCGLIAACVVCILRGGSIYTGGGAAVVWTILGAAVGAFIGWFAAEMIIRKTFRVFDGLPAGACVAAGVLALGILIAGTGLFGFENCVPDPAEVSQVSVAWGWPGLNTDDEETIRLTVEAQKTLLENKAEFSRAGRRAGYTSCWSGQIIYTLDNGRQIIRCYTLYDPADVPALAGTVEAVERVLNSPAGIGSRKLPLTGEENQWLRAVIFRADEESVYGEDVIDLSGEEASSLYAALEADMDEGTVGTEELFSTGVSDGTGFLISVDLYELPETSLTTDSGYITGVSYQVTARARHTIAWLAEHCGLTLSDVQ